MIAAERRTAILRELRLRGTLSVSEFAGRLGISPITLRRDLAELEREGQLARVHGGATSVAATEIEPGSAPRSVKQLAATFGLAPRGTGGPVATIGMIAPTHGYYYTEIIAGAKEAARLAGVRLVLAISDYNPAEERRMFERMVSLGLDGILITPSRSELADSPLRDLIESSPVPVTVLERVWEFPTRGRVVDSVRTDHRHGAEIALSHLIDLGHRHVGGWSFDNPHAAEIRAGFEAAAETAGCIVHRPVFDYGHADWDSVDMRRNVRRYLEEAVEAGVTAVLVHPDEFALQMMQEAAAAGIDVPGELSIVAYDDEVAGLGEIPLTAVAPPKRSLGFVAVDACLRSVAHAGPTVEEFPSQRVRLLPVLRVRESTGSPR
ncbi:substrate-binding domain-containing protein [Microbacterium sp. CIAB417]|uniref:substrate-binding domain-containing protein n=1 Tax=Microbacterium sp. CIAB417 TaxID=2860287 RepID=UPI001FABDD2D|nr:substrate-binding domain-containing protein [Microbacterium sp. CIAB417]